jgi:glycosyltransferase involved in cell wall biosynthesis
VSYGGSVIADYELDQALVAEGHSLTVLTGRKRGEDISRETISDRHEIRYFSVIGSITYGCSVGALFNLFTTLRKNGRNTDLVWFGGVWNLLTILGPVFCRLFSVRYIITPHGMLIPNLISLRSSRLKRVVIRWFLKSNLEKAFRVHFTVKQEFHETTEATQAEMSPVIFPLCFDLRKFDSGIHEPRIKSDGEQVVLSFIGRITPKKRIDLIFEALKMLPSELKSRLVFRIVGSDTEKLWNKESYTESAIGLPVNYLGPLYDQALVSAFDTSDIFILCSESENFGIAVVEAAYCHTALILSKEVGVSEYFLEGSATYANLNARDICQKISDFLDSPAKIYEAKLAAREVSEQFDSSYLPKNYFQDLLN